MPARKPRDIIRQGLREHRKVEVVYAKKTTGHVVKRTILPTEQRGSVT